MKKIMDEKKGRSRALHAKGVESYHIEVDHHIIEASATSAREIMIKGAQVIRKVTKRKLRHLLYWSPTLFNLLI